MVQEEVAVLLIFGGTELEGVRLGTALAAHALAGALLLAHHGLHPQFAELQVGAQAEQAAHTRHQPHVAGKRHIAGLYEFDDIILLAVILEFEVLRVIVEGGLGVVVEVHVHLVAHLSRKREIDFLVEVETKGLATVGGQCRVVHVFHVGPHLQFCASLGLDLHPARTEDFLRRSQVKLHVGKVELVLPFCFKGFGILLPVVAAHTLADAPLLVFLGSHQQGGVQVRERHARLIAQRIGAQQAAHRGEGGRLSAFARGGRGGGRPGILACSLVALRIVGAAQGGAYGIGVVLLVIGDLGLQVLRVA